MQVETCPSCLKPKNLEGKGSITGWLSVCVCNLEEESEETNDENSVLFCKACQRRIVEGRKGSLTQWVFRSDICNCEHPEPTNERLGSQAESNSASKTSSIPTEEEAPELAIEPGKFPTSRYKPLKLLGEGANGCVYMAYDRMLRKKVAVKCLMYLDAEKLILFQREARTTSKLSHPSIIRIHDFGVTETGAPYMVLEWFEGQTLEELILANETLTLELTIEITIQICNALNHAHNSGVYHRDLKPANILVGNTTTGAVEIKLIDFGVSAIDLPGQESTIIDGRKVVGTPQYMSPDQASGLEFDARSEIYSV